MSSLRTAPPPSARTGAVPAPAPTKVPASARIRDWAGRNGDWLGRNRGGPGRNGDGPSRNGDGPGGNGAGAQRNGALASVGWIASIDSTMQRVMIQMEPALLERAKRAARERGVSFPQLIREALARELALSATPVQPLSCVGVISTGGEARGREYEPEPWR